MILKLGKLERKLKYTTNTICDLESSEKVSILKLLEEQAGMNTLRLLLWAGLRHDNKGLTKEMVGDWIQEYTEEHEDGLGILFETTVNELVNSGALGNGMKGNLPQK